jgi:hypothetical protein
MSTSTLVALDKLPDREDALSSTTATPARNSLDMKDEEKQTPEEDHVDGPDPPELSQFRLVILMLGLCLSMFLVALDFVCFSINFTNYEEYLDNGDPSNY